MKMKSVFLILMLAATLVSAQTNSLTSLLQQGLLEEQANRNLDAAIANYQSLAAQFDKDRQLAATAVFRIGECYRMQGKTNEAAVQYQRILKDFSDQQTLAMLSQQNLAGMARAAGQAITESSTEMRSLAAQLSGIEQLKSNPTEYARAVQAVFPDDLLKKMLENLPNLTTQEAESKANSKTLVDWVTHHFVAIPGQGFPTDNAIQETNLVKAAATEVQKQNDLIAQRVDFILGIQKARLKVLQSATGSTVASNANQNDGTPATTDEEDQEIRRIQQMIQNSPDLINVPKALGITPLKQAASAGWIKVATYLLGHGADVNANGGGSSPLNNAAQAGNRAMVELLLSRGANLDSHEKTFGETALHTAAKNGFFAVTEVLLANKADVNALDSSGNTPLILAAQQDNSKIVSLLLDHQSDVNARNRNANTALLLAARGNNPEIISLLLEHKADVNAQDDSANTPLRNAASWNHPEIAKLLLTAGANPNVVDNSGQQPLSYAAANGSLEIVKMLLAAKADPNGGTRNVPLLAAISQNRVGVAELLLQGGAKPNLKSLLDSRPVTPLGLAIQMRQLPLVQLLLKYKADPNDTQADGRSLLFSTLGDTNILATLLDAGAKADVIQLTEEASNWRPYWTPLGASANVNNAAAMKILLEHDADPNLRYSQDWTPLRWAAYSVAGSNVFQLLLDHKANPNVRDNQGETPLKVLKRWAKGGYANTPPEKMALASQLVDLLRQHGALDNLPDWDRITVSRPTANFSQAIFDKGTNDWNQVSLYDLIGVQYDLLTPAPAGTTRVKFSPYSDHAHGDNMPFPNFTSVIIHHPSVDGLKWETRKIDLAGALNSGKCDGDVMLQFGDVVEIPEANHVLYQQWRGLTTNELLTLKSCLMRHLKITVNGQSTNFVVSPQISIQPYLNDNDSELPSNVSPFQPGLYYDAKLLTGEPFMLWPVLDESKMLLSSSDLSQVKVKRHDAATGKMREWTVDCSDPKSPPNFWLRDGDVIEVPERR